MPHTQAAAEQVLDYCKTADVDPASWFDCLIFDGIHEYGPMEEPIARLVGDLEQAD